MATYFAADPTELRLSVSAVVRHEPGAREVLWTIRVGDAFRGAGHVDIR